MDIKRFIPLWKHLIALADATVVERKQEPLIPLMAVCCSIEILRLFLAQQQQSAEPTRDYKLCDKTTLVSTTILFLLLIL